MPFSRSYAQFNDWNKIMIIPHSKFMFAKASIILILLIFSFANKSDRTPLLVNHKSYSFYVGTYTDGGSEGIYEYKLKKNGHLERTGLVAKIENPSFLAKSNDNKYVISVSEIGDNTWLGGTISSFKIQESKLNLINSVSSGGSFPCFISINSSGIVLVANYGSGTIALLELNSKGILAGPLDIQQHTGKSTGPGQNAPHAHYSLFEPEGKSIISIDLGTNELWFSKIDSKTNTLKPSIPEKLTMDNGAGPRHMTFHNNQKWAYVINELTSTVTQVIKSKSGVYEKGVSISTIPLGYEGENFCADIHLSNDGKFLYASNRGHNSIAIYKVDQTNGQLTLTTFEPTLGDWPRNFSLTPDNKFLLVANQKSNSIISFKRNKTDGSLRYIDSIAAPSPVCLLF